MSGFDQQEMSSPHLPAGRMAAGGTLQEINFIFAFNKRQGFESLFLINIRLFF
jgi:hypothetical protein